MSGTSFYWLVQKHLESTTYLPARIHLYFCSAKFTFCQGTRLALDSLSFSWTILQQMTWLPTPEACEIFFRASESHLLVSCIKQGSHNPYGLDHHTHDILLMHSQFLPLGHTFLQLPQLFLFTESHPLILTRQHLCNVHSLGCTKKLFDTCW